MNLYLKVKITTLAEEAKIIRRLERRIAANKRKGKTHATWTGLNSHRRIQVRREARASALAYGFLRGRSYHALEFKCHEKPDWKNVEGIIKRFAVGDERDIAQRFEQWKQELVTPEQIAQVSVAVANHAVEMKARRDAYLAQRKKQTA